MIDKIILIICGVLFILLTAILIWWLIIGKQHFIEKRCPERLVDITKPLIIGGDGNGKKIVIENPNNIETTVENKEGLK